MATNDRKENSRALLAPQKGRELKISKLIGLRGAAFNIKYSRKSKHTMEFLFNFPPTYIQIQFFSFEFTPGIQSTIYVEDYVTLLFCSMYIVHILYGIERGFYPRV